MMFLFKKNMDLRLMTSMIRIIQLIAHLLSPKLINPIGYKKEKHWTLNYRKIINIIKNLYLQKYWAKNSEFKEKNEIFFN